MKVLILSKACYVAAYRRKLEELATLPDIELTLVVPPYWRQGKHRALLEPGFDRGYRLVVQNPVLNGAHHLHFYPRLGRLLDELAPELVHIDEEPYDFVSFHALLAARSRGCKAVFFTWQNLLRRFPPPFGWMEAYVLRHADGAIAGSAEAAEVLKRKGFKGPLAIIPQFGVDPEVFRPDERGTPQGRVRLGYLGRLVEEKGIRLLLRAASDLQGDWELELVGDGPLRQEIEAFISDHGLKERVRLSPSVPSMMVPQLLQELDIVVLPSLTTPHWKEQFGRVLVEAMACGVAVVGSDSGEIPNVIGDAGLVCREGDVDGLRSALQRLIDDTELRRQLGGRGRDRVLSFYTQRRVAEATYRFYRQVLG